MLGRNDEAIEFLTQADPESGWLRGFDEYWVLLTLAYHQLGDYERELEAVGRMLQLNPERSRIALGIEMGVLAAEGRIEELGTRIPGLLQSYHGGSTDGLFDWFTELHSHGYPGAASNLLGRALEWFEDRPSDWRRDPGQSFVYGNLLSRAGRWGEAQAVLEGVVADTRFTGKANRMALLELAYVLASQGYRNQAYRAVSLSQWNDIGVHTWVEAALGERERAMELLREIRAQRDGAKVDMLDMHGGYLSLHRLESMRDYPPFVEEFLRPNG